jgi:hypothetical protein
MSVTGNRINGVSGISGSIAKIVIQIYISHISRKNIILTEAVKNVMQKHDGVKSVSIIQEQILTLQEPIQPRNAVPVIS